MSIRFPGRAAVVLAAAVLVGCGDDKTKPPSTDPANVKKLEEEQRKGSTGEK